MSEGLPRLGGGGLPRVVDAVGYVLAGGSSTTDWAVRFWRPSSVAGTSEAASRTCTPPVTSANAGIGEDPGGAGKLSAGSSGGGLEAEAPLFAGSAPAWPRFARPRLTLRLAARFAGSESVGYSPATSSNSASEGCGGGGEPPFAKATWGGALLGGFSSCGSLGLQRTVDRRSRELARR